MTDTYDDSEPVWEHSEPDGAALDDFGTVFAMPEPEPEPGYTPAHFTSLSDFAQTAEETAVALAGTSEEPLLPAGGTLIMYGDGGAGKTTLTLDAVAHLAAGADWIGVKVATAVRVTLIENEGPRGMFRKKVAAKVESWNGRPPFADRVSILEEPWTRFTLRDARHRSALAEHVSEHASDLVVMGPLVTLGTIGGGTPDEVQAFEELLLQTRELCSKAVAFWIVHHENKAGDVSGAWDRVPDVLCHVQARGNGLTHLVWRKARWSGTLHGTSVDLAWAEGAGFDVVERVARDLRLELLAAMRPGEWYTAPELGELTEARRERVAEICGQLAAEGALEFAIGPAGRHVRAHCWRVPDGPGLLAEPYSEPEP